MINESHFDYIIIGSGLAGFQLALKMTEEVFFKNKKIALIDPSEKNTNDKTWSFWEKNQSQWNQIIQKSWLKASVITRKTTIDLDLSPYRYKTIRAIDFYDYAKEKLNRCKNIKFIIDEVISVKEGKQAFVKTSQSTFTATHIFDSRIPDSFHINSKDHISIIQHFKGWVIETETNSFDENALTMMDYRLKDGNQTTFTYVLPFSKTKALVEFTYFTKDYVDEHIYDEFIATYIKDYLKIETYKITETEMGSIPMTSFPFEKFNTKNITKIGTGGGWVKGSTGYSFKHTEKKIKTIIENIKAHKVPSKNLFKKRFKFYDKVFLKVLKDENYKGEWIFKQFYAKNTIPSMFRFLDEESHLYEELKIMCSLFSWSFIKAFFKTL